LRLVEGAIKELSGKNKRKEWNKINQTLRYLKKKRQVQIITRDINSVGLKITDEGRKIADFVDVTNLKLRKNSIWDGKWRIVIFDVPNDKSKNRLAFIRELKDLGFIMVQRSVWAYPYECRKEVEIIRNYFEIGKFVTYIESSEIEDGHLWLKRFKETV
jgi:DNA-binding transcriptional regulator PaaX